MEEKNLIQIKLGSFIKVFSLAFMTLGVVLGVLAFILSLFGGEVTATVGSTELTGITAGLMNIILFPIIFIVGGFIFGLLAFLPFKYFLKLVKGLKVGMKFE